MIGSLGASTQILPIGADVPRRLRLGARLAGQFLLLVILHECGARVVEATGLPLPGNLVGMLLLLALLRLKVVHLEQVQDAATLLLKHLNLFFVPLAVGLMAWGGLLGASGVGLGASLAGSAAICLAAAGVVSHRLSTARGSSNAG
jgi:holin-like protein